MDRIQATNELAFRVAFSGHSGHLRVEPLSTVERTNPVKSLPDFILPPAFPRETQESIKEHIEEKYLLPRLDPDGFSAEKAGRQWDFDWFEMAKLPLEPSLPRSVVVPTWEVPFRREKKGSVEGMWEPNSVQVDVSELSPGAQDSAPLPRVAGPAKDFVRGSINNRPFRPGGLEESQNADRLLPDGATNGEWVREVLNGGPAQAVAPSLKQGLDLGDLKAFPYTWNVYKDKGSLNNTSDEKSSELSVQFDDLFKKAWEEDDVAEYEGDAHLSEEDSTKPDAEVSQVDLSSSAAKSELHALDEILFVESGALMPTSGGTSDIGGHQQKEASAFAGSSEGIAEHFYQLVPDMALSFPFELDAFQKEVMVNANPPSTFRKQSYYGKCKAFG